MSQSSTKNARKESKIIKIKEKINEIENKETIQRFNKLKADLRRGKKTNKMKNTNLQ